MKTMPLISCPTCSSKLIYPRSSEPFGDGHELVDRRCPECEHSDRVIASTVAVRLWERAQERRRIELAGGLLLAELETWLDAGGAVTSDPT